MKKILFLLTLAAGAIATGCKKEPLATYEAPQGTDNIYISDTAKLTYSFAYNPSLSSDTVWLPVRIAGERVSHERTFKISAVDSNSTAVSGVHYKPLESSYTMPADSGLIHIPIILLNTDTALAKKSVSLRLMVSGGDSFATNLPLKMRSKAITFSSRLEQPAWWMYWGQLGQYSRIKHQLFLISSGTRDLIIPTPQADPNYYYYIPRTLYYINNVHEFVTDPFTWVQQNPDKGYVLTKRNDGTGDYDFYNESSPGLKFWLKFFPSVNRLIFIDENGNQILI